MRGMPIRAPAQNPSIYPTFFNLTNHSSVLSSLDERLPQRPLVRRSIGEGECREWSEDAPEKSARLMIEAAFTN